jgi:hypothetical protein
MNTRIASVLFMGFIVLAACASPTETPPTPTQPVFVIPTFFPTDTFIPLSPPAAATTDGFTPIPALTSTSQPNTTNACADPQVTALIDSLKTAVLNSDGELLASLVSPASGMDVRFFRYGTVVNYDQAHAKFLFETTFEVDWGAEPGSGAAKVGSFHDVVAPELVKSFNQPYTLHCNELKHGGASYDVMWPYDKDFYSVYFPGTDANGNLDWHTWAVGIEYVAGKPYIYALTQYFWEP